MKIIHSLKLKEEGIKQNLYKLNENKKILQNESLNQLELNKKIKEEEIKKLKNKQTLLYNQLEDIQLQINNIISEEQKINKKLNLKDFIEKYESESFNNERIYELERQSNILKQNRINDLERSKEKLIKKLNDLENEEKEKKKSFLLSQREKERELILRRKKVINNQLEKTKKFINAQTKKDEKEYLFNKMKNKYELELNREIKKVKLEKKKILTKKNIKELQRKFEENRILVQKDIIEKTRNMRKMWKNRSLIIPSYKSPLVKILKDEENKLKEKEENEKLNKKLFNMKREKYSIEKVPKIKKINERLLRERKERIFRISDLRGKARVKYIKQKYLKKIKRENNCFKQGNKILTSNENYEKNYKKSILRAISEVNIHNNNNNKILLTKNNSVNKIIHSKKLPKDFDYLKELREKNPNRNKVFNTFNWNTLINKTGNKFENIRLIKDKIKYIDEKAKRDEEILKYKGGSINNPDLAGQLSDLLINSIKGKLSIIDNFK